MSELLERAPYGLAGVRWEQLFDQWSFMIRLVTSVRFTQLKLCLVICLSGYLSPLLRGILISVYETVTS